jgi:hypothetical protein
MNNPSRSMTNNEIEIVVKSLPKMKSPGLDEFTDELYETFKDELTPMLLKFSLY